MGVPIGKVIGALISSVYENPMRRLIASTSPSDPIPNANISTTGYLSTYFGYSAWRPLRQKGNACPTRLMPE
jgi:hypothetical protein